LRKVPFTLASEDAQIQFAIIVLTVAFKKTLRNERIDPLAGGAGRESQVDGCSLVLRSGKKLRERRIQHCHLILLGEDLPTCTCCYISLG